MKMGSVYKNQNVKHSICYNINGDGKCVQESWQLPHCSVSSRCEAHEDGKCAEELWQLLTFQRGRACVACHGEALTDNNADV